MKFSRIRNTGLYSILYLKIVATRRHFLYIGETTFKKTGKIRCNLFPINLAGTIYSSLFTLIYPCDSLGKSAKTGHPATLPDSADQSEGRKAVGQSEASRPGLWTNGKAGFREAGNWPHEVGVQVREM
jgi:hypothetical protein